MYAYLKSVMSQLHSRAHSFKRRIAARRIITAPSAFSESKTVNIKAKIKKNERN
jgi:hypothetical protein